MMKLSRKLAVLWVLLCFTSVLAQTGECSAFVQQALTAVEDACAPTGRNEACYGNVSLDATPRADVTNFSFARQGDLVNVADVETLRLHALDSAADQWGIALMKLQANLPDTLPGQNVTFLLFGDVELQNAVDSSGTSSAATVEVTANNGINVRQGPSTNNPVIGSLATGEATTATGRNTDGTWLRIQIPDSEDVGWIAAALVTADGDISTLPLVDENGSDVAFTPMQAFYFRTGIGQTTCADAPADGILIQTPEGVGKVNLRANDVDIELGSTAYLRAQPGDMMSVSVVEGEGQVTANGETVTVPEGSWVQIPVDENLSASGAPSEPMPYDEGELEALPVEVLPRAITIAPPISDGSAYPTAEPTSSAGGEGFGMPGLDPSMYEGMDQAFFCQIVTQSFEQAGMTTQEYIDLVNQYRSIIPAESLADIDEFIQMLQACPS